jgi:putative ABC transport system permease protein
MKDFWVQAFRQLKADSLRTLLSLLGVSVGIFSILAALTLIDSLRATVHDSFAAYGSDVLFVEREPLEPDLNEDGVFRWWVYAGRPPVTWQEYRYLEERGDGAFSKIAYAAYGRDAVGVAGDWPLLVPQPLAAGRGFTPREASQGAPFVLVGADVDAAVGDILWIEGARYEVIGVFTKAGMTTVSPVDIDHVRLIPYRTMHGPVLRSSIVLSEADESLVRSLLRTVRRLPPGAPDDFSFNRLSFLLDEMNEIFKLVSRLGWIIGLFSLLVGGIGIANMLYVSVEERKPQIGICRALGAKRAVIVREFLSEAVALSLLGALGGIFLAAAGIAVARLAMAGGGLPLFLSLRAILTGLAVALALGLLFGAAPARTAARLTPVEAISGK